MKELILIVLFLISVIYIGFLLNKTECNAKANALGYKSEYHFFSGCVLENIEGKKILLQQLREMEK